MQCNVMHQFIPHRIFCATLNNCRLSTLRTRQRPKKRSFDPMLTESVIFSHFLLIFLRQQIAKYGMSPSGSVGSASDSYSGGPWIEARLV